MSLPILYNDSIYDKIFKKLIGFIFYSKNFNIYSLMNIY